MKKVIAMGIALVFTTAAMAQTDKKYQVKKDSLRFRKDSMMMYKMPKDSLSVKDSLSIKKSRPMKNKTTRPVKDSM